MVSGLGKARAELGMKPEEPGPIKDKKVREELKEKYSGVIEDGIKIFRRRWKSIRNMTTRWPT